MHATESENLPESQHSEKTDCYQQNGSFSLYCRACEDASASHSTLLSKLSAESSKAQHLQHQLTKKHKLAWMISL